MTTQQSGMEALTIVADGVSNYEIVADRPHIGSVREGALELRRLIAAASGVELPVVAQATVGRKAIVVGAHPLAAQAGIAADGLAHDAFRLCISNGTVYLIGNDAPKRDLYDGFSVRSSPSAGTYHAVVEFARRFLGAHWYMPGPLGEEVPRRTRIQVPGALDVTVKPRFPIRMIADVWPVNAPPSDSLYAKYYDAEASRANLVWARRLRLGISDYPTTRHAWAQFMPADGTKTNLFSAKAYGQEHPEYYALRNGVRQTRYRGPRGQYGGQLCTSNPDVARVYAENVIAYARRTGVRSFSLSQNDGGETCQCDGCRALWFGTDADGKPIETDAEMRFANRVAELVLREIPDARFGTSAYNASRHPPLRTKLHPAITISDVYNWYPYDFYKPKTLEGIIADIRGWREQVDKAVLLTYYTGHGHWSLPWSTVHGQGERCLPKLMAQWPSSLGMSLYWMYSYSGAPVGAIGADLWVFAQLLWDPSPSVDTLLGEYYDGAFGPEAGPLLRKYFDRIDSALAREVRAREGRGSSNAKQVVVPAYTSVREECARLIRDAEASVAGREERYRWRVDRVARAWRFAELTLDAVAVAKRAAHPATGGDKAAWEAAVAAGRARATFPRDPANRFAVSGVAFEGSENGRPLGAITELPASWDLVQSVPRVTGPIEVDGRLDETVWAQAVRLSAFKEYKSKGVSRVNTSVRILYTAEAVHVGFECFEGQMREQAIDNADGALWNGDCVECYISPEDLDSYAWFVVNPDGRGMAEIQRGDHGRDADWRPAWRYAAAKSGDRWTVEMCLPWDALRPGGPPARGEAWRANFVRKRFTGRMEFSAWAPTGSSAPLPSRAGLIRFEP